VVFQGYREVGTGLTHANGTAELELPADVRLAQIIAFKSKLGLDCVTTARKPFEPWGAPLETFSNPTRLTLRGACGERLIRIHGPRGVPISGARVGLWVFRSVGQPEEINVSGSRWTAVFTDEKGEARLDWLPAQGRSHSVCRFATTTGGCRTA
jgi:hypothetical protein